MENSKARIKMIKMILEGENLNDTVYNCEVIKYDNVEECIYLVLKGSGISDISLDGIYNCTILKGQEMIECEGRILERYCNQKGNILRFQVEKGFYKININCVDKEEA